MVGAPKLDFATNSGTKFRTCPSRARPRPANAFPSISLFLSRDFYSLFFGHLSEREHQPGFSHGGCNDTATHLNELSSFFVICPPKRVVKYISRARGERGKTGEELRRCTNENTSVPSIEHTRRSNLTIYSCHS